MEFKEVTFMTADLFRQDGGARVVVRVYALRCPMEGSSQTF